MDSRGKSKPVVFPRWINVLVATLILTIVLYVAPSFLLAQQLGMTDVDPNAVLFDSGAITGVGEQTAVGVTMVGPSAVGSIAANVMCASYVWAEGYRYCVDLTFGFPTPGMCVGPTTCLGLGTVAITGVAIGIGKGIVGKILGGGDSSGSGIPAGGIPLTGGSKAGCSGTPYISTTPSTDSCAVYIPTGATAGNTLNLGGAPSSPSVSSLLFSGTSNSSGTTSISSGVSNTLLTTGASASPQTSVGGQLMSNTASGGTSTSENTSSSIFFPNSQGQGAAYTLGTGAGNSSLLSTAGNSIWNTFSGGGASLSNAGESLLNIISGNTNAPVTGVSALLGNSGTNTGAPSGTSPNAANIPPKPSGMQPGTWGDIQADPSGVTITAGAQYADGRTSVGGFYGYNAVSGVSPQNLAKQMCSARSWGTSSAAAVVPPSFFDNICTARGYKEVVVLPPTNTVGTGAGMSKNSETASPPGTSNAGKKVTATAEPSLPAGPVLVAPPPSVVISAVPARVRIGARSTIYWSAKGVTSCTETSEDGSFNGDTLSGGASTVALYGNTAFTITCKTPDGSDVTKSVMVETSS